MKSQGEVAIRKFIEMQFPSKKHNGVKSFLISNLNKVKKAHGISDEDLIKILNTQDGLFELGLEKRIKESHFLLSYIQMCFSKDLEKLLIQFDDKDRLMILNNLIEVVELKLVRQSVRVIDRKLLNLRIQLGEKYLPITISQIHSYFSSDLLFHKCVGNGKWDYYTIDERDSLLENSIFLSHHEMKFLLSQILDILKSNRNLIYARSKGNMQGLGSLRLNFSEMFKFPEYYQHVITFLVSKGWFSLETMKWDDSQKGYQMDAALMIKYLMKYGYFIDGLKLTNQAIKELLEEDLGVVLGISTIQHAIPSKDSFRKLGPASKIPLSNSSV